MTMKKILSIAFVALFVVALASCKKTYVTQVTNNVVPNQTYNADIQVSDWTLTTDGKAYTRDIQIPTKDFFNDTDATIAELTFDTGDSKTYEPMPYVYNGVSFSYTHYISNTDGFPHIIVYSQLAGGAASKPTETVTVKLVLIPSS